MSNSIIETDHHNLPANLREEAEKMIQETASANPTLVFKKGKFFIEDEEIGLGRRYIGFPREWTRGWTKWEGGRPVSEKLGRASEYDAPPRAELGDLDKSQWEDQDQDPWQQQNILPLVDLETDEFVLFRTGSWGGLKAIKKLVNKFYREIQTGRNLGNPIVAIGTYDRPTEHGPTPTPKFDIVSWENADAPLPPIKDALGGDEIPL
jgi:hypothetical protein